MERVTIAEGLSFSRFVAGMLHLPDFGDTDAARAHRIEELIEMGVTTFDHADYYADYEAEKAFGRFLASRPGLRSRIELVTKCGNISIQNEAGETVARRYDTSYENILASVEGSLKRLQTDCIDLFLLHRIDHLADPRGIAQAFSELRQQGKVRYFGVSNYQPVHLEMLRAFWPEIVVDQLRFSPYDLENFENGSAFYAMQHGIRLMAYSPVSKGKIFREQSEKAQRLRAALERVRAELGAPSLDTICYSFLLRHPARLMPIVGTTNPERMRSALAAVSYPMSNPQWYSIYESSQGMLMP